MTLQSSGAISLLNIQNEFKSTDELIELLTGVSKLSPTVWTNNTPFPGRSATTGTATGDTPISISPLTIIDPKTSYGSITYSNTSNDDQPSQYSIPINEYYRNGSYVPDRDSSDALVNQNVPTSGEISLANFYDGINEDIILFINSNRENLNLETAFNTESGNGSWTNKRRKRLIINRGIVIGGTSANADKFALKIPPNLIGGLIIVNYGDIVGYGGSPAQPGGSAILVGIPQPTTIFHSISNIDHNLKSGIYGVITQYIIQGSSKYLTPIGSNNLASAETNYSIAHGTGEFSVGDSIYIYNIKTSLASDGSLIESNAEQLVNLCKISEKVTATFTAYISKGDLITKGNILSVISEAQPSVGMGIITGSKYKKHIITRTLRVPNTVIFDGNKLLRGSTSSFIPGMVIFGTGVLEGTIVKEYKIFYPSYFRTYWGTINGNIFTLNETPTEALLPNYFLGVSIATDLYIVKKINDTTYEVNASVSNVLVYSYSYIIINKSQTITGPVNITGVIHFLDDDSSDGITNTDEESELISTPTSMTAVLYTLDRTVNISKLTNKSNGFKFFTAGGTTSPGFTVTTISSTSLSALTQGQSVTISGSTATATGTNTPVINASKFNGTWNNIDKLNDTQFFVATTKIDNTYKSSFPFQSTGLFPTTTVTPFTTPIKILNYGRIYGGGGGGSNSVGTRSQNMLKFFANINKSQTQDILGSDPITNTTNNIAAKVTLEIDPGFNGVGGNGQGYNQQKTQGTGGTPNPNSQRYVTIECFGPAETTSQGWSNTDPYLDLISIPENTKFRLFMNKGFSKTLVDSPVWQNVFFGQGTSLYDTAGYTLDLSTHNNALRIGNIYNFSDQGGALVKIYTKNKSGNSIDKIYTNSLNWRFYSSSNNSQLLSQTYSTTAKRYNYFEVGSTAALVIVNPHPQDRVRIVTTKNKFTYDMDFASMSGNLALPGGEGGDFGSPGKSTASATIPAGLSGNYILNSSIYSNVTWINTGDVKGEVS